MDEPETDTPSATPTLSPVTRVVAEEVEPDNGEGPGLNCEAKKQMSDLSDAFVAFSVAFSALRRGGRQILTACVSWLRADTRNAGLAVMAIALVIVGFIAYDGHNSKAPQPPKPATATQQPPAGNGVRKHKIASRESLVSIGARNGVGRDEMIAANLTLIRENTAWCKARPVSSDYLRGILKGTTAKRDSNFCVMFDYNGEELALDTAKVGQIANVPFPTVANNEY